MSTRTDMATLELLHAALRGNYEDLREDYLKMSQRFARLEEERDAFMKRCELLAKAVAAHEERSKALAKELEELHRSISGGHTTL